MTTTNMLTTGEVAAKLGVTDSSIRQMCRCGTLKASRIAETYHPDVGAWAISPTDLADYVARRSQPRAKVLSMVDRAYIAGLLDGEGCFTAFITRKPLKAGKGFTYSTSYFAQIIVKDEAPIKWLKEVTGSGHVFQRKRQEEGRQNLWGWRIYSVKACEIVEQILPYLKIKHRQAEIFLQLRDWVKNGKAFRSGATGLISRPRAQWVERQKLIDEIHLLNDRTGKRRRMEFTDVK